ncbi:hypothetical protein Dthio_PD1589 [Desulfonatronospira thiodismutans ASO3-1]|uniref:Uncharacterized protein n=1 Tax=Desulfonatronospira thiodismutans ASO3-1 TaxID=555779 RepID=D6SNB2_9BACT|nr:hypothetical protein Dthio_PD1589 [Desulfonatronospira thiodismutans ASO3-1]
MKKGLPHQAGSLLFIYTGSVDMDIIPFPLVFSSSSLALRLKGRFGPGVRYFC